jgi:hypothetical protein
MKVAKKRFFAALALTLVFAFSFVQLPVVYSEEVNVELEDEALSVIVNVIGIDVTKYNVELNTHNMYSVNEDSPVYETISYTLQSAESKIKVRFKFLNQTLVYWSITPLEGSPEYIQPLSTNTLDTVKDTLHRYQTYSKTPIVQEARDVLDTVNEVKSVNITVDNMKLQITENTNYLNLNWARIVNGLEFGTGLGIRVNNGIVDVFSDKSSFFHIGSADVNIPQQEAIRIAWEEAKNCTTVKIWKGDSYEVFPFHLVEEQRTVQLYVGSTKDLALYPYWKVWFVADPEVYTTTGFEVTIRADTGEITKSRVTSYYGTFPDTETPADTTSSSGNSSEFQLENSANLPLTAIVLAAVVSVIAIIAIVMIVLKKRSK